MGIYCLLFFSLRAHPLVFIQREMCPLRSIPGVGPNFFPTPSSKNFSPSPDLIAFIDSVKSMRLEKNLHINIFFLLTILLSLIVGKPRNIKLTSTTAGPSKKSNKTQSLKFHNIPIIISVLLVIFNDPHDLSFSIISVKKLRCRTTS